ncbi:MAG: hypothetical protein M3P39_01340, partial [Actinomycetota bacterium]|nr:hypothetical protein [Actinomycetota bacterium]
RVGGPDVVREALAPKRDEQGQPLKWAAVCAEAARGLKPGDPVFAAWVRLAGTPVQAIKAETQPPAEERPRNRGGPRGGRRSGPGQRSGPPSDRGGRGDRDRPPRATELREGSFRPTIRIAADPATERAERDRRRKEQREAKRQAERDRLSRLGY